MALNWPWRKAPVADSFLAELKAVRQFLVDREDRMRHLLDYLTRVDEQINGLDIKLREVLSREAKVSNLARDAYHQWLLSFDQVRRDQLVAKVREDRVLNGTAPTGSLPEGKS